MNIKKINSLVELFFYKLEEIDNQKPFLKCLKKENKHQYNWLEVSERIYKFSNSIKKKN